LRRWILIAALCSAGSLAGAQDVLDGDEWEAIMRATAPAEAKDQEARATVVEEKPRGRRGRARDRAEIEKAAASVDALNANAGQEQPAASSEPEKPGKRGKKGAREKAAPVAAAAGPEKERAGRAREKAAAAAAEGEKTLERVASGKGGAADARSIARGGKSAAAEKPLPPIKRGANDRGVPANYVALKRSWHAPWSEDRRASMAGMAPPLIIHPVHPIGANPTPYVILPESTDGGFSEAQLEVASQAWASYPGGPRVSERLLNLIYHAAIHFDIFHVHLISGVRKDRGGSRHSHGLAADIVLPGVSDEDLATYFRAQGFCGVGIYTRAGFVHIDTRDQSYFWLDWSLPGRRNRQQQILGDQAKAADEAAMARGQNKYVNPPKLQKALAARLRKRKGKAGRATAQQVQQEGS
jgi:hypothetical protein